MIGTDFLLAVILFLLVNTLLISPLSPPIPFEAFPTFDCRYLAALSIILIAFKYVTRLYRYYRSDRQAFRDSLQRLTIVSFLPVGLVTFVFIFDPSVYFPTETLEVSLLAFILAQIYIFYRFSMTDTTAKVVENVLVFGTGPLAARITEVIKDPKNSSNFCGYVQPCNAVEEDVKRLPCSSSEEILQIIKEKKITRVIVALKERRGVLPVRDMFSCKLRGVEVVDALNYFEIKTGKLLVEYIYPGWFVFSKGFLITRLMFKKQRIVDIVMAGLLLLLTLPLFPLIAIAIRLDSPGKVLFRQRRVGFKEKEFDLIKFRTMCENAEAGTGAVWAQETDSRVTRLGGWMRKFRIDELPQLINVLKGEMSFIGPRPERPEFVRQLSAKIPYYSRRHSVRPGLTGWAQINYPYGASEEDALEKLRYDLYFIKNFSLVLEMKIILGTFRVVLFGKGGR
jgi:sugar transferase (PEP-CTERM system associated)